MFLRVSSEFCIRRPLFANLYKPQRGRIKLGPVLSSVLPMMGCPCLSGHDAHGFCCRVVSLNFKYLLGRIAVMRCKSFLLGALLFFVSGFTVWAQVRIKNQIQLSNLETVLIFTVVDRADGQVGLRLRADSGKIEPAYYLDIEPDTDIRYVWKSGDSLCFIYHLVKRSWNMRHW